ncbi:MAG: hypothetical protein COB54_07195 [Alphaproteobacteria bacterium]|nr:MAG: hypothetical protein COB54_07195 [Alphaproteobacteria bacterium]
MDTSLLTDVILPLALASLMFGMGLLLRMEDFFYLTRNPRTLLIGLTSLLVVTPILGWGIAVFSSLDPIMAVGIVMVCTCPGGTFSNLLTSYAKGNLALSISMTASVTLIYLWFGPIVINLALGYFMDDKVNMHLPILNTLIQIFTYTLAPIILGMVAGSMLKSHRKSASKLFRDTGALVITIIFLTLLYDQRNVLLSALTSLLVPILLINLMGITSAILLSRFGRISQKDTIAIILEHTIRQEAMALFIATSILSQPVLALPLLMNSLIGLIIGLGVIFVAYLLKRTDNRLVT